MYGYSEYTRSYKPYRLWKGYYLGRRNTIFFYLLNRNWNQKFFFSIFFSHNVRVVWSILWFRIRFDSIRFDSIQPNQFLYSKVVHIVSKTSPFFLWDIGISLPLFIAGTDGQGHLNDIKLNYYFNKCFWYLARIGKL